MCAWSHDMQIGLSGTCLLKCGVCVCMCLMLLTRLFTAFLMTKPSMLMESRHSHRHCALGAARAFLTLEGIYSEEVWLGELHNTPPHLTLTPPHLTLTQ